MSQEPWNDEIYDSTENTRKGRTEKGNAANRIFTILAVLFLIIVIAITSLAIYLSSGGSKTNSTQEFYSASSPAASSSSVTQAPASEPATTTTQQSSSSSEAPVEDGSTLTVQPGEGEASIAARAGISIADLERLNPDKMSTGSWLAHPGDTVRIK